MAHARLQADGGRGALSAAEALYGQRVTQFVLRLFLDDHPVDGRVVVDLARVFLTDLMLPGTQPTTLQTRRTALEAKLNDGPFSERRWEAAVKKILAGDYGAVGIDAQDPRRPERRASLSSIVNPPGAGAGVYARISVSCSVPYARELAADPARVEALLRLGTGVWRAVTGGAAYGYANVAYFPSRPMFGQPGWRPPGPEWITAVAPPAARPHPIPVAYTGDVDSNLEALFRAGRGIKGAFWANFLAARHVRTAGGESAIRAGLPGLRVEPLSEGGLLIVATPSPLPEDTEDTRRRFEALARVLEPAFLSRAETPEGKRPLLGYFARP